jgi:hypothetical protein
MNMFDRLSREWLKRIDDIEWRKILTKSNEEVLKPTRKLKSRRDDYLDDQLERLRKGLFILDDGVIEYNLRNPIDELQQQRLQLMSEKFEEELHTCLYNGYTTYIKDSPVVTSESIKQAVTQLKASLDKHRNSTDCVDIFVCLRPMRDKIDRAVGVYNKKNTLDYLDTIEGIPLYSFETEEELRYFIIKTQQDKPGTKICWIKEDEVV